MGAWGYESCSNDSTWDCLYAKNIHEMTQKECDDSLNKLWEESSPKKGIGKYELDSDKLGVVIWILHLGKKVKDISKLEYCLETANKLLAPKWLRDWRDSEERKRCLEQEIEIIKSAIKNNGKGDKRHIMGLFEKIEEKIG